MNIHQSVKLPTLLVRCLKFPQKIKLLKVSNCTSWTARYARHHHHHHIDHHLQQKHYQQHHHCFFLLLPPGALCILLSHILCDLLEISLKIFQRRSASTIALNCYNTPQHILFGQVRESQAKNNTVKALFANI